MTLRELADRVGCTSAAISQFEAGSRNPSESTIQRMAKELRFPVPFLLAGEVDLLEAPAAGAKSSAASFRSLRSLTAKSRARALAGGLIATEISAAVSRRLSVPTLDLPDLAAETPERAAALLRTRWAIGEGPIDNMVHLLEAKGVRLFWTRNEDVAVDAFCFWKSGLPYVMLGNDKAPERSRRDAAHELGHLVLHRHGDVCGRQAEEDAERFASSFLMPGGQYMKECGVDPSDLRMSALKRRWKVTRASAVRRAFELGLMTEWHYRMETTVIGQDGPAERDPIDREESAVFAQALSMLSDVGITVEGLADELFVEPEEVLNFIPLARPERWLAVRGARILDWDGGRQKRGLYTYRGDPSAGPEATAKAARTEDTEFAGFPGAAIIQFPNLQLSGSDLGPTCHRWVVSAIGAPGAPGQRPDSPSD